MLNPACAPAGNEIFSDNIPLALANKYIGVVGSRQLPAIYKDKVKEAVKQLLDKGYDIASGGAVGADNFALEAILELDSAPRGIIFSPWQHIAQFPIPVRENIKRFVAEGGKVIWGDTPRYADRKAVVAGLLGRNVRLVSGAVGLIAFPFGDSRGTAFTLRQAQNKNIPVSIFQTGGLVPISASGTN